MFRFWKQSQDFLSSLSCPVLRRAVLCCAVRYFRRGAARLGSAPVGLRSSISISSSSFDRRCTLYLRAIRCDAALESSRVETRRLAEQFRRGEERAQLQLQDYAMSNTTRLIPAAYGNTHLLDSTRLRMLPPPSLRVQYVTYIRTKRLNGDCDE